MPVPVRDWRFVGHAWKSVCCGKNTDDLEPSLSELQINDRETLRVIDIPELFTLTLADGTAFRATEKQVVAPPTSKALSADASAARYSERLPGKALASEGACSQTEGQQAKTGGHTLSDLRLMSKGQSFITSDQRSHPLSG